MASWEGGRWREWEKTERKDGGLVEMPNTWRTPCSVCLQTMKSQPANFLFCAFSSSLSKISAAVQPRRQNPTFRKTLKKKEKKQKTGWGSPRNSAETYGRPRPALWPRAQLHRAAAPAANPQSWTCLDATRHVDSLRQERKKVLGMFSLSATLHSYTGVWGRIRASVQSPPDPNRKLPTACTHFPPGLLYGSLKNWEVLGTGPAGGTHPPHPAAAAHV